MLVWFAAAFCAFFIKGLCGFANTLVFTSILSFGTANFEITPVELLLGFPSNVFLSWRGKKRLLPRLILPLAVLLLAGNAAGAFLLKSVDPGPLKILFGLAVIAVGVEMLLREKRPKKKEEPPLVGWITGLLSGVLCGLFGVGALLAAYLSRVTDDSETMKANVSALFVTENHFRVLMYALMGIITAASVKTVLLLLPAALLGLLCGIASGKRLDERLARRLVIVLLMISGAVLITKNL